MTEELNLNDQNFEETIQTADKAVLVDFWAQWCEPCLMLSPILEKAAEQYNDKLILAKVNLDEAQLTAQKFGIEQIPTVMLFKKGKQISKFIGVNPESMIKNWLEENLK